MNVRQKNKDNEAFCITNGIDWGGFEIKEHYHAGIKLLGSEIKPILKGQVSMKASYGKMSVSREMYIYNMYVHGTKYKERKLLLKRKQIIRISTFMKTGWVLMPEHIYKINNLIKIKFALAKHLGRVDKKAKEKRMYKMFRQEAKEYLITKVSI